MQLSGDSLIWALSALAQLNRTPFDPKLILQQFAPPYSTQTLHEAASHLGLKVGFKHVQARDLNQLSLPCLAVFEPVALPEIRLPQATAQNDPKVIPLTTARLVDAAATDVVPAHGVALIVQADTNHVSFFDGTGPDVRTLPVAEFAHCFTGEVLLFVRQPAPADDNESQAPRAKELRFHLVHP